MVVDANGARWDEIEIDDSCWTTDDLIIEALDRGHDGLIVRNVNDLGGVVDNEYDYPLSTTYAVFRPEQIKSATGNPGTYDPEDPRIADQAGWDIENKPRRGPRP
jgi:hypothetical protein